MRLSPGRLQWVRLFNRRAFNVDQLVINKVNRIALVDAVFAASAPAVVLSRE